MKQSKIVRVETWVNKGVPDCLIGLKGGWFLVELKVATKTGKLRFSPHQVSFHKKHEDLLCFIVAASDDLKNMNVYHAKRILELNQFGLNSIPDLKGPLNGTNLENWLVSYSKHFIQYNKDDISNG